MIAKVSKKYLSIALLFFIMFLSATSDAQIVLNEVMPNPGGSQGLIVYNGNSGNEYIELYNNGCTPVNVAGYLLACRQEFGALISGGTFVIPNVPAATIQPKSHLVIGTSTSSADPNSIDIKIPSFTSNYCQNDPTRNFILANADGWISLYDQNGTPLDGIYWTSNSANITNPSFDGDYNTGAPCKPSGVPASVTLLNARALNALGKMTYVGVNPNAGRTFSRFPDGGSWKANIASTINDLTYPTSKNCNCNIADPACGGSVCFTPIPAVTNFTYATPFCATGTATPTTPANLTPGGTWTATPSAGITINSSTGVINLASSTPGSYTIRYEVTGSVCSPAGFSTFNIVINAGPSTTAGSNSPVCEGASLTLNASNVTGATYAWTGPNGFTSSLQNPTVSATATAAMGGTYSVIATVAGCPGLASTTNVTINPKPVVTAGNNGPVCIGAPLSLTASNVTGATYTWSGPNGYSASTQNPTVNASATAAMAGSYSVTATVGTCQSLPANTTVIVNSSPTVNVTAPAVCAGSNATVTATPNPAGTYSYVWTPPAGGANPGNLATFTTTIAGAYSVIVTNTTTNCSSAPGAATVTFNANPTVTVNSAAICSGQNATITATPLPAVGGGTNYNYAWTVPGGVTNPGNVSNFSANTPGNYSVIVTNTSTNCASTSGSGTVTSATTVTPSFPLIGPFCVNATAPALPGTSANSITGNWSPNTINTSTAGTTPYTFTPNPGQCASGPVTVNIIVNALPTVTVTGASVCAGNNATVTANPLPAATYTYAWTTPAGATNPGNVATFNATLPGSYDVVVTNTATSCSSASASGSVAITPANTAGPGSSAPTLCINSPLTNITHTTSGATGINNAGIVGLPTGVTASWAPNTITISGTPAAAGTFNYTIPLTGGCGNITANGTITVVDVPSQPVVTTNCTGGPGTGVITVTAPIGNFEYSLDGGTYQNSTTFNNVANGPHTIRAREKTALCLSTLASVNLNCGCLNPPTVSFNAATGTSGNTCLSSAKTIGGAFSGSVSGVTVTHNGTGTLSATSFTTSPFSFDYTPGAGEGGSTVQITVLTDATDPLCSAAQAIYTLSVRALPTASVTAGADVCPNGSSNFTITGTAGATVTYTLNSGGNQTALLTGGSANVPLNNIISNQTIILVSINDGNCSDFLTGTSTVTVIPNETPTFAPIPGICINATAPLLPGTSNEGIAGTWNPNVVSNTASGTYTFTATPITGRCFLPATLTVNVNTTPAVPQFDPVPPICINTLPAPVLPTTSKDGITGVWSPANVSTTFSDTYTFTPDPNQCAAEATLDITIALNPVVELGEPRIDILEGESVTLRGIVSGTNSYVWTPTTDMTGSTTLTPVVNPTDDVTYTLTATTSEGCVAKDTVRIIVLNELIIPNVFSPNNDGINDRFEIENIEKYKDATVDIFNRYGQRLMRYVGGYNTPWDGRVNGKDAPVGTYFYVIIPNAGKRKVISGSISIVR